LEENMKNFWMTALLITAVSIAAVVNPVKADGIIIPEPPICHPEPCFPPFAPISQSPLAVKEHIVSVTIKDQLAVTRVDQIFINTSSNTVEGTYLFPLPQDAVVQQFALWVDGKPIKGRVLTAEEARQTYEDIVRSMRDPALLEYVGRGAYQACIFPIPPGGESRVELEYSQVLTSDNGLVRYTYPLNTEKFSALPLEKVAVTVELETSNPIRAVYSPSHEVDVIREGQVKAIAGYEAQNIKPDTDFSLYYSYGDDEAMHLFTYRDEKDTEDRDGFFLMLAAPKPDENPERVAKDILLVIDRSGSMDGEKMDQARSAAKYVLSHLGADDRFQITTFSSGVNHYANGMSPAGQSSDAARWVDQINAGGSTDINRALLEAMEYVDADRPTYLLFITDGLPTVGERQSGQILRNIEKATPENLRLFSFGVGFDVDTLLLDTLSQNHHGISTYVKPDEPLDDLLSGFYEKISTPVLTNLEIIVDGVDIYDVYPNRLPDLFQGSQLVITGRYREGGSAKIVLEGQTNNVFHTFQKDDLQFTKQSPSFSDIESGLPRIWAARKIGHLLNILRLEGNDRETIDQIVKLSIRYGIVTPYTSYLVTEPMPLGSVEQERLSAETFRDLQSMPAPSVSGADAVQKAQEQNALSQSDIAPVLSNEAGKIIKTIGARTFVLKENIWIDTTFDPIKSKTRKIGFLSEEYFHLARTRPDIAACLSLGQHVIIVDGGQVLEVVD
jgi:Ca-activated chloride channel family protein